MKPIPISTSQILLKLRHTPIRYYESVSAGFPSPAQDYLEKKLDLEEYLIRNPSTTFLVKVEGMSMIGAGIYPDDILIVDKSVPPKPNDVIVAVLEGEFTVKRFVKKGKQYFLVPENNRFQTIEVTDNPDFEVWGVITFVIHNPALL